MSADATVSTRARGWGILAMACREAYSRAYPGSFTRVQEDAFSRAMVYALLKVEPEAQALWVHECDAASDPPEATGEFYLVAMVDNAWIESRGAYCPENFRKLCLEQYPLDSRLRKHPAGFGLIARPAVVSGHDELDFVSAFFASAIQTAEMHANTPQVCRSTTRRTP